MMGVLHLKRFSEKISSQAGFTTLTAVLALAVIGVGLTVGVIIPRLQDPQTTQSSAQENSLIAYVRNSDIGIQINGPTRPSGWDYSVNGTLCFNVNPPNTNSGKFRVELRMPTRNNPAGEVIGASQRQGTEEAATMKCAPEGRVRRDPAYNAVFNIPDRDQWLEACPEIQIHVATEGPWDYSPQSRVGTINRSLLCPDGIPNQPSPTAATAPTAAPTDRPAPTSQPGPTTPPRPTTPPSGSQIDGRITVYSCQKPESVLLTFCDASNEQCIEVPYNNEILTTQGVWRQDGSNDRTHEYLYIISKDRNGELIKPGTSYTLRSASALVRTDRGAKTYTSNARDKSTVQAPVTRDFTIDTDDETCGCTFRAKAFVKDADTGQITTALDSTSDTGALINGLSNDMQVPARGNRPGLGFSEGEIDTGDMDFWTTRANKDVSFPYGPYGRDGLGHIRLIAPNYTVTKQECTSTGEVDGCPTYFKDGKHEGFADGERGKDFRDIRVACGVNIAYGWTIKAKPQSEITPQTLQFRTDLNNDGVTNTTDLSLCIAEYGTSRSDIACDINADGIVNAVDYSGVIEGFN